METLDLKGAAAFLRMNPEALRRKARAGVVPGGKPGVRWVFLKEDLAEYLRSLYPQPGRASRDEQQQETPCDDDIRDVKSFINAMQGARGSCNSPPRTAAECIARLKRETRAKRRSISTTTGAETGE